MAEGQRGTILLVDDEASIRMVAERMLELAGYDVICCATAEEALAALESSAGTVDVLLSDIHLDEMNGPALAAEVRRRWPSIGVVMMSGYTEAQATDTGMAPGTRFLGKPYRLEQLAAAVEAALVTVRAPEAGPDQ